MTESSDTTYWFPFRVISSESRDPSGPKDFAIIVLNQPLELRASIYQTLFDNSIYKVAADGGANRLHDLHLANPESSLDVDCVIGDLDSLAPTTRKYWEDKHVPIIHDPDQNSTDFTKAVNLIRSSDHRKNIDIVVLGGLGGRVDQGLSTLHHLYTFQNSCIYSSGRMYLLSSESITFLLKSGKHKVKVKAKARDGDAKSLVVGLGKYVGIIPLKEQAVITTEGLEWDVSDWVTELGGQVSTSNHVREEWVTVETQGDVLFTIDLDFPALVA